MSDICKVIPKPTPLTLGGRSFLVSELRLDDVAALQAGIKSEIPAPYDRASRHLEDPAAWGTRPWKRLLGEVCDAQAKYPPEPGDAEAEALLTSVAGRKVLIALALRREHSSEEISEALSRYDEVSEEEHSALVRAAWGTDPMLVLSRMVDGPSGASPGDLDWGELWYRYLTTVTTGPQFGDLTISQYVHFRAQGSPSRGVVSGPDALEVAKRRREFFSESDEPEEADDGVE